MADSFIALDEPAVTDKKLDTTQLTVGANTVQRERMVIAGAADTDLAPVSAIDGLLVNLGANNDVTVAGVATAAKQDTQTTHLATLAGAVAGTEVQVDVLTMPSVAVTNAGLTELAAAIDTEVQCDIVGALPAGNNNIGDIDVASIAAGDNNIGNVDIVTMPAVAGAAADDAAVSGNPVRVAGASISPDGTDPGSVSAEGDTANLRTDLNRRLLVSSSHPRTLRKHLDGTSAYTDESIVADPGDGFQVVITNIIASNGEAVALNFFLEEGSTKIFGPIYLPAVAGSGFCSGPIYLPVTASTAVTLTSSAANDQSFDIEYFIQAV